MYEKLNLPHPLKKSLAFSLAEETTVSASSERFHVSLLCCVYYPIYLSVIMCPVV